MMYGKIKDGIVDEVRDAPFDGAVALPDGVTAGWTHDAHAKEYLRPGASDAEIDAQTARRIQSAWGAPDRMEAALDQINAQARLDAIARIDRPTQAQKTERAALIARQEKTQALRAKGKALKALGAAARTRLDIADDTHWTEGAP